MTEAQRRLAAPFLRKHGLRLAHIDTLRLAVLHRGGVVKVSTTSSVHLKKHLDRLYKGYFIEDVHRFDEQERLSKRKRARELAELAFSLVHRYHPAIRIPAITLTSHYGIVPKDYGIMVDSILCACSLVDVVFHLLRVSRGLESAVHDTEIRVTEKGRQVLADYMRMGVSD